MLNACIRSTLTWAIGLMICGPALAGETESAARPPLTEKHKAAGGVDLAMVKIPEKQKSVDLCPVHLLPSDPILGA